MWLGVDTGGTFTDFVLFDGESIRTHKVLSTPAAPEQAILQGIESLGLSEVSNVVMTHGSTVATNAVLEGKGVRLLYIANRGLKDVILIGRQARKELYELQPEATKFIVDTENCIEVDSRLSSGGEALSKLSDNELQDLVQQVDQIKPDAIAINLLFSYLNDSDEKRIEEAFSGRYFVSRSSKILNEYREYERGIATCLNSYVGPLMKNYLSRLDQALPDFNISIMQSNAGTISIDQASESAVNLLLSGPAGGLKGAQFIASVEGKRNLLSFDMGGTSTDVAMIKDKIELTNEGEIAVFPVAVPMVDMHTIGAGGGSIARVDSGGMLLVGPESAGASPGPACYGTGGEQATVTDANVVLGRIPREQALGGYLTIDKDAAEKAVEKIAKQLNVSIKQAAAGIIKIANEHMVQALRVMSVQRGYDPKEFTLVSFGGAGGLHICDLAEALNMSNALIPVHGGVLSAFGMLVSAPSREMSITLNKSFNSCSDELIDKTLKKLIAEGQSLMQTELSGEKPLVSCSVDVCYSGQSFSLGVKWSSLKDVEKQFHILHERRYGHRMNHALDLVTVRVKLEGKPLDFIMPSLKENNSVISNNSSLTIVKREALGAGHKIVGPALVLESVATSFIKDGWTAIVDKVGNMELKKY